MVDFVLAVSIVILAAIVTKAGTRLAVRLPQRYVEFTFVVLGLAAGYLIYGGVGELFSTDVQTGG